MRIVSSSHSGANVPTISSVAGLVFSAAYSASSRRVRSSALLDVVEVVAEDDADDAFGSSKPGMSIVVPARFSMHVIDVAARAAVGRSGSRCDRS